MKTGICTFVIISRSYFLRMRNVAKEICSENQKTHFILRDILFENRVVCEIMWKKIW